MLNRIFAVAAICIGLATTTHAAHTLVVATKDAPPFAMKSGDGRWSGLSVELWQRVADSLGVVYELRETELDTMLAWLGRGEVDAAVAALTVTSERERQFDFSQPYFSSGLGIAVRRGGGSWFGFFRRLFSPTFLRAIGALSLLLLIVGVLIWLAERRVNAAQFGGTPMRGIGSGFWWSAVTMTTVGYGDKAPMSFWGRALGLVWMFTAIITISTFTASISAALTVSHLGTTIEGVKDLPHVRVGTVSSSTGARYLDQEHIRYHGYGTAEEALGALAAGDMQAVVYDAPILKYLMRTSGSQNDLVVLPELLNHEMYAVAMPTGSGLREAVNVELLRCLGSDWWRQRVEEYLGAQ